MVNNDTGHDKNVLSSGKVSLLQSRYLLIGGVWGREEPSSSQVVSLSLQSVMEVANFCVAMDTLIDQDGGEPAGPLLCVGHFNM